MDYLDRPTLQGQNARHEITIKPLREGSKLPQVAGAHLAHPFICRLDLLFHLREEERD